MIRRISTYQLQEKNIKKIANFINTEKQNILFPEDNY